MKDRVDWMARAVLSVLVLANHGYSQESQAPASAQTSKTWRTRSQDVENMTSMIEQGASIDRKQSDVRVEQRPHQKPIGSESAGLRKARVHSVLPNETLSQSAQVTLVPVRGANAIPQAPETLEASQASKAARVESVHPARQARILDLIPLPRWKPESERESSVIVAEPIAPVVRRPVFSPKELPIPETSDDSEVAVVVQETTLPAVEPLKAIPREVEPTRTPSPRQKPEIHVVHADTRSSRVVSKVETSPIQRVNALEIEVADNKPAEPIASPARSLPPSVPESGVIELDPPAKDVVQTSVESSESSIPIAPTPIPTEDVTTPASEEVVIDSSNSYPVTTPCATGNCALPGSKFCGPPLPQAPRCVIDPTVPQMRTQHVIQLGDELEIIFPYQPLVGELTQRRLQEPPFRSERVLVREDGMITLPLIDPVMAAGLTPEDLRALLISRYKTLAYNPVANQANAQARVYRVCVNDELEIRVRNQPELDDRVVVSPDGRISLLRIGSIVVEGKSIDEIQSELTTLYAKVQSQPEVSVSLREFNSDLVFVDGEPVRIGLKNVDAISVIVRSAVRKVFVMGEVRTPGQLGYQGTMTLSQALASAGGPLRTARLKHIKILRRTNPYCEPEAITVDIRGLMNCKASTDVPLNHMDVVVVGKTPIRQLTDVLEQYVYEVAPMTKNMPNINLFYSLGGGNNGGAIINTNP